MNGHMFGRAGLAGPLGGVGRGKPLLCGKPDNPLANPGSSPGKG